jgi:autotransporter-associated beta strand protein
LANISNLSLGSNPGRWFHLLAVEQPDEHIDRPHRVSFEPAMGERRERKLGHGEQLDEQRRAERCRRTGELLRPHQPGRTATVDGAFTAGSITFDSLHSYTVAGSGVSGHGITLNNSTGGTAVISVLRGEHTISAPLALANHLQISASTGSALTLSGAISGSGGSWTLNSGGTGTVTFSGATANTYTALTTVAGGNLNLAKTGGVDAIGSGGVQVNSGASLTLLARIKSRTPPRCASMVPSRLGARPKRSAPCSAEAV